MASPGKAMRGKARQRVARQGFMIDDRKWWRAALAGQSPPITENPEPGFFKRRLVKAGPWVPVAIWIERELDEAGDLLSDEVVKCTVDGRLADPDSTWSYCAGSPITEAEFDYLSRVSSYAKASDKREPLANPRRPINALAFPLPTFKNNKRKPRR